MDKIMITRATLSRLPYYLQFLKELPLPETPYISATTIARALSLGEVQVRKDLNAVDGNGKPRRGYNTAALIRSIEEYLGYNDFTSAVLVGAGKLGRALLDYDELETYGVRITAAFDSLVPLSQSERPIPILSMDRFEPFCREHRIQLGIITVGEGSAQMVCDAMVKSGIIAIWSFAPCKLEVPEGVLLRQENLALSLAHLNNQLHSKLDEERNGPRPQKSYSKTILQKHSI